MTAVKVNGQLWAPGAGKSNGSSKLTNRKPVINDEVVEESEVRKQPPNSQRDVGIIGTTKILINEFNDFKQSSNKSDSSIKLLFNYLSHGILLMIFFVISIYKNYLYMYRKVLLKLFNLTYYPNKSPQVIREDVNKLTKIPKRLSCIVNFKDEDDENGGIDGLMNDISELVAWSISAGIQELNIYEYNGVINPYYSELNRYINRNLKNYFGTEYIPNITIKIPHSNKFLVNKPDQSVDLAINLLSKIDGKPTILELTKTISELAISKELLIKDINIDLINEELIELVGNEPDLLIVFNPNLDLQDYPPWHIRLTEIYWEPDNKDVTYGVFLKALQNYAKSKVNVGK